MRISTIILLLKVLLLITLKTVAQQGIKGTIYDKNTRSPLTGASITIYTADKSIAKGQATTDDHGHFVIPNPPAGNYNLIISYMGYKAERIPIIVSDKAKSYSLDLKQTGLLPNSIKLGTIDIKGNKPLITIRKDTIEFSASDFYTAENASLKNLLQKIPGLTIGQDGSFYFQGRKINDLYIDGRPAFGKGANSSGDPKEISQLLQANLVDKIQMADRRGLDGLPQAGSSEKVINITLKKEMKKGVTGAVGAGYGTHDRYAASGNANMFRSNKMIMGNFLANNNNMLTPVVGSNEEFAMMPFINGINTVKYIRGTGSFDINPENKINTSIFGGDTRNDIITQTNRTNVLPDSSFNYNSYNSKKTDGKGINYTISTENKLDEKTSLNLGIYGSFNKDNSDALTTFSTTGKNINDTINKGQICNIISSDKNLYTFNGALVRTFNKPNRLFFINFNVNHRGNVEDQMNFTLNEIRQSHSADTINQKIHLKTTNNDISFAPNYKEPLSSSMTLNLSYSFSNSLTRNEQYAYNFDYYKMDYSIRDNMLSYIFRNSYFSHLLSSGLSYNKNKFFSTLFINYNINKSTSTNYTNNKTYEQAINYWTPGISLTYKNTNFSTLNLNFTRATTIPKMESLIPVVSITNPLYITLGNPDLKPTVHNLAGLDYSSFSVTGTVFRVALNADFETNGLGTSVYSDSIGRQVNQPVNVSGNFYLRNSMSVSKRFTKASISINYNLEPLVTRNSNFINYQSNTTTAYNLTQRIDAGYNHKKDLEANVSVAWSYIGNKYSIQNTYIDFLQYYLTGNINVYLPLDFNIGTSYTFTHNTAQNKSNQLLNGWISKTWLADKSIQTKFACFDILRQYKSFQTVQSSTFIEQTTNNILTQYFIGSLTWYFGKKKAQSQSLKE